MKMGLTEAQVASKEPNIVNKIAQPTLALSQVGRAGARGVAVTAQTQAEGNSGVEKTALALR